VLPQLLVTVHSLTDLQLLAEEAVLVALLEALHVALQLVRVLDNAQHFGGVDDLLSDHLAGLSEKPQDDGQFDLVLIVEDGDVLERVDGSDQAGGGSTEVAFVDALQ